MGVEVDWLGQKPEALKPRRLTESVLRVLRHGLRRDKVTWSLSRRVSNSGWLPHPVAPKSYILRIILLAPESLLP